MIDIGFDFTTDSPGYWEGFWDRNDGLGYGGSDLDSVSHTLQNYHQILWSKKLPNGEKMELWQSTPVFFAGNPHEQHEKAKRYDTER